jgi:hypothetical protein
MTLVSFKEISKGESEVEYVVPFKEGSKGNLGFL